MIGASILLIAGACVGEVPDRSPDAGPVIDASLIPRSDGGPQVDGAVSPDAASAGPMVFNIIMRQSEQACSSCGIWFDWQGQQANKPRLVVQYEVEGQTTTREYQHGLDGTDNAQGFYLTSGNDGEKHSMLVKQTPHRTGLFRADLTDIPPQARIVAATLHLHLHTGEGLANSDRSSVLAVHACERTWDWDTVTWTHYAPGQPWTTPGGDFGALVREIRANEDLQARGYNKANPNARFDFTEHVTQLHAAR